MGEIYRRRRVVRNVARALDNFKNMEEEYQQWVSRSPQKKRRCENSPGPWEEMSPHAGGSAPAKPPRSISEVCIETLPRGIIEDVAMTLKLKGLRLRILPGHQVFLMNPTNAPVQVWVGCRCAGFLKGKWVTGDEQSESDASHILCKIEDAHSMVFYGKKGGPNSGRLGGRYAAN